MNDALFNTIKELDDQKEINVALLEAARLALKVFHMDSDMEEDFAPEIEALTKAIRKAE